uniref:DUF1618 domain-containing protein n=1 Tax=Leersia perrieri TaxID=77586 RepID=A0A0D9UW43_9ORYZ
MAARNPPLVLLDRITPFVKEAITDGSSSSEAAVGAGRWTRVVLPPAGSSRSAVKPVTVLAEPPRPSSLYMLLPPDAHIRPSPAAISTIHKGILLLRTILYDYILYDLHRRPRRRRRLHTSDLALPQAKIFTWSKSDANAAGNGEWVQSPVSQIPLPAHLCGPDYHFQIDMTFSFHDRIFWVDLLHGILLCDLLEEGEGEPKLSFIPLPDGCCINVHRNLRHTLQSPCNRSMACVSGVIKFVAMVGYDDETADKAMLKTWALSPDFKIWTEDTTALSVGDIWASESFNQMGLPHVMPISPMLSMTQDGIMYAILNVIDMEPLDQLDDFGECLGNQLLPKANYIIRFDIRQNKVLSYTIPSKDADLRWMQPTLLTTDFTAYLQVSCKRKGKRKQMEY